MELKIILDTANKLKAEIDTFRPLSPELEKRIMQKFRLDWNYHSNNIEGNQLTYGETKTFLLHGITAKGKTLKDHLDIKGHNEALLMLDEIVKEKRGISENFIRELHVVILHETYYNPAQTADGNKTARKIEVGKYKSQPNHVLTKTGEMHYFASPEETPAKMHDLITWYRNINNDKSLHPLIVASIFHYRFISIHPFDDGNGRLARILMNLILMQNGFPPVIIKTETKGDYYSALQEADGGNEEEFIKYVGEQLIHSLELYLKGAKGENIEDITDIDKQIELLKASLSDNNETQWINIEIAKKIHDIIIAPTFELLINKLSKFDELFSQRDILFNYFDNKPKAKNILDINPFIRKPTEYNVCGTANDLLSTLSMKFWKIEKKEDIPTQIEIRYYLSGFKKSKEKFDCAIDFVLKFNEAEYFTLLSNADNFKRINISYSNIELLEDDKLMILNTIAGSILKQINEQIKKENR